MRTVIIYRMMVLLLALLAAAGFASATLLVETRLGTSRAFQQYSVVVAAGILLGVAVADLIPEAFELVGGNGAALAIVGGFLVLYLVEALTGGHTHHHEPHPEHLHDGPDSGGEAQAHVHHHGAATPAGSATGSCVPTHAVAPFLLGLGLHNLADGVVIGASHEASDAAAAAVAVGILVHQMPVGLSFAAVLLASGVGRGRARTNALLVAAIIPFGALLVLVAPDLGGETLGLLVGAAAGALLYIATGHLLPEAHSEERRPGIAGVFALSLVATVLFVGALHDTAHGDEAAHEDIGHGDEHADEARDGHAGA